MNIRRIEMDVIGQKTAAWVLYEPGSFSRPVAIVSEYEMELLVNEYKQQQMDAMAREPDPQE